MSAFLVDANLPRRIVAELSVRFPDSVYVGDVGLDRATDLAVWDYARVRKLTILSKDSDFHHLSLTFGAPPKFVWLRAGNCTVAELIAILTDRAAEIDAFDDDMAAAMLVLGR